MIGTTPTRGPVDRLLLRFELWRLARTVEAADAEIVHMRFERERMAQRVEKLIRIRAKARAAMIQISELPQ